MEAIHSGCSFVQKRHVERIPAAAEWKQSILFVALLGSVTWKESARLQNVKKIILVHIA